MIAKFSEERRGEQEQSSAISQTVGASCHMTGCRNVGDIERLASGVGGGALLAYGIARRSLPGVALAGLGAALLYRGFTGHCPTYQALGINTAGKKGSATSVPANQGVRVDCTITIDRSPTELYAFWRNLENLPRIMRHLESVRNLGAGRSHWVARGPLGTRVEWDAEVITDRPPELIGWRSLPGSSVDTAGSVHFRPVGPSGPTELRVEMKYLPPAGKLGATVARLLGEAPEQQIDEDLRRFKQAMQTGAEYAAQGQFGGRMR